MPHNHIFMQQAAEDELLIKVRGKRFVGGVLTTIEDFVAGIVLAAFLKFGLELSDDQVIRYDIRITNTMPVDIAVNVTVWYTEERAVHLEDIRQEILERLSEWAPRYDIEVHIIPIGVPIKRTPAGIVHPDEPESGNQ